MNPPYFHYKAFGLVFRSTIRHPELPEISHDADPDCLINFGKVPYRLEKSELEGVAFSSAPKKFLLRIEHVGRYLVEDGKLITIEKTPGATDREVIVFLWASAMAALLHQRGVAIIHGSAIDTPLGAVIFSGPSGSGKTTTAAAYAVKNKEMVITDDISAIAMGQHGKPVVLPGYPLMKLWRDSSDKIGFQWDENNIIREDVRKMLVSVSDRFLDTPALLRQIYLLSYKNGGYPEIRELTGVKKLELVMGKVFRKNYLKSNQAGTRDMFNTFSALLPHVRVCTLERPHGIDFLDRTLQVIEEDLRRNC